LLANAAIGTTPHTNSFAMQEKNETTAKKKVTTKKKATTKKEDTAKKENSTPKEDTDKKEDAVPKEETTKKEDAVKKPHFSEERIKEIVQRLKKQVAEHRRLQNEGILPFYKRIPITVMEIPYVMVIINRERGTASALMKEIRAELGKRPRQKISVTEFSDYTGIPISDVRDALNNLT
jgi:hypothetical protein